MNNMILHAHPTGNANAHHAAQALAEADLLAEFLTCLAPRPEAAWLRVLPPSVQRQILRRAIPESIRPFTHLHPWRELGRMACSSIGWMGPLKKERGICSIDAVYRSLDRAATRRLQKHPQLRAVYLYEDGAADTFNAARKLGLHTFYDLPIGHWQAARNLLGEEAELQPSWASTLHGNTDSADKLARKDRELSQADTVIVASTFTKSTLDILPNAPRDIITIPYGAPSQAPNLKPARRAQGEPLRVLFVGSLGQRKGLSYLLDAMEMVGSGHELTLIGKPQGDHCHPLDQALHKHRHIPSLPHHEILKEMIRAR